MIDYLDEARFESAQNEIDLVGLITKRLCSDAAEYAYRHQRAKEVLSLMPDDFEPDNRWRENAWIRKKKDSIAFYDTKVRRGQLKADIKKLRRELLVLLDALNDVPEVCR